MDDGLIALTGAAGLIGRASCAHWHARGRRFRGLVRALDVHTAARAEYLPIGDLALASDAALVNALSGATTVVHLAARVHRLAEAGGPGDAAAAYRRDNVETTLRLAHAAVAAGARHFVFASTVKIHGETSPPGRPWRESDPPDPHGEYARSKLEAERRLAEFAEESGLQVTALRLPLTYGPGVGANFAALMHAVGHGVPLPFAAVRNRRSLLCAGNFPAAVDALLAAESSAGGPRMHTWLVADAEAVSTTELVEAIARAMRVRAHLFSLPAGLMRFAFACAGRADAIDRLVGSLEVDASAFRQRFGWTPPCDLARGLAAMCGNAAPL